MTVSPEGAFLLRLMPPVSHFFIAHAKIDTPRLVTSCMDNVEFMKASEFAKSGDGLR